MSAQGPIDHAPAPSPAARLTPAQEQAVMHRGGPLIVVAGPGTGKTRVIIHRIASLISEGVEPEQIVAVTFTVKAAEQMRARLAEMLGASAGGTLLAARVNVHTFHGLGLRILNRFPDLAGLPGQVELLDGPQGRAILRDLITDLKILPEAAGAGREAILAMATSFQERLWNAGVEPASAMQHALAWGRRLDEEQGALPKGDEEARAAHREAHLEARHHQRRAFELARLLIAAEQEMRGRGLCAFGDMIALPIRLLSTHDSAAAVVRQEYRHYVVDEFQDVNAAQVKLLRLLCLPVDGGGLGPDLCVVGDDDQAIYAFRGSDERAMHLFAQVYPQHQRITLEENFRSRACIVDFAGAIMEGAPERFSAGKRLRAAGPLAGEPGPMVQHVKTEKESGDAPVVAAILRQMRAERPGVPWERYAVIARTNPELDRISTALALAGIPAQRRARGWSEDESVKCVLAWVDILVDDRPAPSLTRVLVRPPFSLDLARVADWMRTYRAAASRAEAGAVDLEPGAEPVPGAADPGPLVPFVLARAAEAGGGEGASGGAGGEASEKTSEGAALRRFSEAFHHLRALSLSTDADEMIFRIIQHAGVLDADLPGPEERAARVRALVRLIGWARMKQRRLPAPGDLEAFRAYWNDRDQRDDAEPSERVDAGERPVGDADEALLESAGLGGASEADAGVHLITAHSAKGLEFDTVIVPRVCPPSGYPSTKAQEPGVRLPPGCEREVGGPPPPGDDDDGHGAKARQWAEERRVFYVACTRAERRLVVMGRWARARSTSLNFLDELVRDRAGPALVQSREEREVLAAAGANVGGADPIATGHPEAALRAGEAERFADARARVRREAAAALDAIDHAGAGAEDLDAAERALARCAATLNGLAHVQGGRAVPGHVVARAGAGGAGVWAAAAGGEKIAESRGGGEAVAAGRAGGASPLAALLARPMEPPLTLSYTMLDTYRRCPRCAFVRYVLKLPDRASDETSLGTLVHQILERFYAQWRAADSEGRPRPGRDELIALGRRMWTGALKRHQVARPEERDQLEAQLRGLFDRLHDPEAHILELERAVRIQYPRGPHRHTLLCKIDRVDDLGDGRLRLVDYKSGQGWKRLLNPERKDLQLGLYAMALAQTFNDGRPVGGSAEYWVLQAGQRGVIALEDLDLEAIQEGINESIDGMLGARWERSAKCQDEVCALLDR